MWIINGRRLIKIIEKKKGSLGYSLHSTVWGGYGPFVHCHIYGNELLIGFRKFTDFLSHKDSNPAISMLTVKLPFIQKQ